MREGVLKYLVNVTSTLLTSMQHLSTRQLSRAHIIPTEVKLISIQTAKLRKDAAEIMESCLKTFLFLQNCSLQKPEGIYLMPNLMPPIVIKFIC